MARTKIDWKLDARTIWLILGMIFCALAFIFIKIKTIQVIALLCMLFIQIYLDYFYSPSRTDNFSKILTTILFVGYFLIFLSISVGEVMLSTAFIFLLVFTLFGFIVIRLISNLNPHKKPGMGKILLNYFCLVIITSLIFGMCYNIVGLESENQIINSDKIRLNMTADYLYFSAFTFYSLNNGEIVYGLNKLVVLLEIFLSFIIHAVVIARAVDSL